MNIAIFTDTYLPDINGVVSSCATLADSLRKLGHRVYVVTNHSGTGVVREGDVLRLPGMELKRLYGYKLSSPVNFGVDDDILNMDLDVIHINTEYGVRLYGVQFARNYHIPLVYTYHTMWEDYTHYINPLDLDGMERMSRAAIRSLSRKFANNVQAVIAPSSKTREALEEYGVIVPIHVIPTGLDLERFQLVDAGLTEQVRVDYGLDGKHVALFVGRLAKEKNLEMVMEAVDRSADADLVLVVVGSGPDADHYELVRQRSSHPERFVFTGRQEASHVPAFYHAAACFVSASTSETQGMTYVEALASGLPVFGRRDPVLKDLLEEGVTGFYFDSAEELVEKLDSFFVGGGCDKEACMEKADPYTEERFGQSVQAVYEQAVQDYEQTWKVEKMLVQDDFVLLSLSKTGTGDAVKLYLPIDDFFELKIGMQHRLDTSLVKSYLALQEYYLVYMAAKRRVAAKEYTSFQLRMWAITQKGLDEKAAHQLCEEFEEKHLVNDRQFALDKAGYWHDMGNSRQAIRSKLVKAGIAADLVQEALGSLDEDREYANARSVARTLLKSVREQSSRLKRQTIINKLLSKGYSLEVARKAGEDLEIEEDDGAALLSAYRKARRLYGGLDPDRRQQKIVQYLRRKGFDREDLERVQEDDQ